MKLPTLIKLATLLAITNLSFAKVELSPLTSNVNMWDTNSRNFADRFSWLDWKNGSDKYARYTRADDLTFWGEEVAAVKLQENRGVLCGLKIELLNQERSLMMSPADFKKQASKWKALIDEKLGSKGKVVSPISMAKIKHTRIAWNSDRCVVILSVNSGVKPDRLEVSFYEKDQGLATAKLKGQQDTEYLAELRESQIKESASSKSSDSAIADGDPNESKQEKEIRKMIREISSRKAPSGIPRDVQDAVNELNVYRYLSSVPYNVKADKKNDRRS